MEYFQVNEKDLSDKDREKLLSINIPNGEIITIILPQLQLRFLFENIKRSVELQ